MISGIKKRSSCDICGGKKEPWQDYCTKCRLDLQTQLERADAHVRKHRKIYAISIAGDKAAHVKFGYSLDPVDRMEDLQIGCPLKLELLASCDGTYHVEQAIHEFLRQDWHHGEWFSRTERVDGVVEAIRDNKVKSHIGMYGPEPPIVTELKRQLKNSV